jgi:hypothetical protein
VRHIRQSARIIHWLTFWDISIYHDIQFKLKGLADGLSRNFLAPKLESGPRCFEIMQVRKVIIKPGRA